MLLPWPGMTSCAKVFGFDPWRFDGEIFGPPQSSLDFGWERTRTRRSINRKSLRYDGDLIDQSINDQMDQEKSQPRQVINITSSG